MSNQPHNRPQRLRPAGSLSVEEAAALIGQMQRNEYVPEQLDEPLELQLSQSAPEPEQLGNELARELADALGDDEDPDRIDPEDILFGPHASVASAEDKHFAAWALYTQLRELQAGEPVEVDAKLTQAKAEAWDSIESAFVNFRDGGFDWQLDSAPLMRELQSNLDQLEALQTLDDAQAPS